MSKIKVNEIDIEKQIENVKSPKDKDSSLHFSTESQKKSTSSSTPIGYCRKVNIFNSKMLTQFDYYVF